MNESGLFSFFSPQLMRKISNTKVVNANYDLMIDETDDVTIDDKTTGIVNENFEHHSEEDVCTIDSISEELTKLEIKKKSLEEEIEILYRNEMGLDDLLDLVTKISSCKVVVPSSIIDEDISEVQECFEMLKSTSTFVEKRLKKMKLKPKPNSDTPVKLSDDEERSLSKQATPNNPEVEAGVEHSSMFSDREYDEDSNDDQSEGAASSETKRVSYDDFVSSNEGMKDVSLSRFQKTRKSLRKVFKKKST